MMSCKNLVNKEEIKERKKKLLPKYYIVNK